MKKQNNPIIRNSLFLILGIFLVILVLNYILTSYFFNAIEQGQYLVNIAGKNRTNSQLILIDALKVSKGNENLKVLLREHINEHARILRALRDGGNVVVDKQEIAITEKADEAILPIIKRVEAIWKTYQEQASIIVAEPIYITIRTDKDVKGINIETDLEALQNLEAEEKQIINPKILKAIEFLSSTSNDVLSADQQLVREFLKVLDERRQNADLIILILTFINIGAIIAAFFVIKDIVLKPLNLIAYAAADIAEGYSSEPINYEFNNEVGSVVKAINKMVATLENATNFIQEIGSGNLDASYKGIENQASLEKESLAGALLDMRERMINVAQSEENQKWINTGITKFVDILRQNNDDLKALSYSILENLIRYIEAVQGGFYIINDEAEREPFAELIAAYAFGKQKFIKQKIYAHEGVIGQVLIDKDTLLLQEVPEEYADITSGLGGATPKSIIIIPLKLNEKLVGLIELNAFKQFEQYKIDFLERLANNIASTISNTKVNEKTRILLEEQSKANLQISLQEENMRKSVLQLQAAQEDMKKNAEQLRAQSYAIASTLLEAEYDMEGRLINANSQFLDKFRYKLTEIMGKNHRNLLDTQSSYSEQYLRFWDNLKQGKTQIGEYKRVTRDGIEIWLRATYVPIPKDNERTEFYKVTCLAFDVTEEKKKVIDYQGKTEALERSSVLIEFDLQGIIGDANQPALEILGYRKDELLSQHYNILLLMSENEDDEYKVMWRQLKGGKYQFGEFQYFDKEGQKIWLEGSFNPIFDLNGNTTKIFFIANDITKRKETERQILEAQKKTKAQEENLLALINNTDERILAIDKHYFVTIANQNIKQVFSQMGRDIEVGTNILDTFPERSYSKLKDPYDKALSGEKIKVEESYISSKGEEITLLVTYNPILDDNDHVQGVTVFAKDITEIKKTQAQLVQMQQDMESKEANLRALINNLEDCVFAVDLEYHLVNFNETLNKLVTEKKKYNLQIGDSLDKLFSPSEWEEWKKILSKTITNGEKQHLNLAFLEDFYDTNIHTITDKNNKITGITLDMRKINI